MADIDWNLVKQEYIKSNGAVLLKELAAKYGVKDSTVRSRKNREKWDNELNGVATQQCNVAKEKQRKKIEVKTQEIEEIMNSELNDKQRLFCLYFVKNHNQTLSAIKAGYSPERAHVTGSELVRNSKVKNYICQLKGKMTEELFLDAMDVLNMYIKIAFVDPTDYLIFGQKEVPVMTMYGPLKDEDGEIVTKMVNYVDFKESSMLDGTVISEVKQGKDGVSIKFEDRLKALDKLSEYFDLFPDKFKRKIEAEKLKLNERKVQLAEKQADNLDDDIFYEVDEVKENEKES